MDRFCKLVTMCVLLIPATASAGLASGPLRVHHQNRRYFADASGKALFLTGSHTWANFQERICRANRTRKERNSR
ncbi:MAG: hypothetical protein JW741_19525 [Sedimentisphaerales bacterium]|nr:hypothetical protein [Sedimentisphaerales bacterium]